MAKKYATVEMHKVIQAKAKPRDCSGRWRIIVFDHSMPKSYSGLCYPRHSSTSVTLPHNDHMIANRVYAQAKQ